MNGIDLAILNLCREEVTYKQILDSVCVSSRKLRYVLRKLIAKGIIVTLPNMLDMRKLKYRSSASYSPHHAIIKK